MFEFSTNLNDSKIKIMQDIAIMWYRKYFFISSDIIINHGLAWYKHFYEMLS